VNIPEGGEPIYASVVLNRMSRMHPPSTLCATLSCP